MSDSARLVAGAQKTSFDFGGFNLGGIMSGLSGLGSLFGGSSAKKAAAQQFQYQMQLQQQAQQWSEYMYKNRYQMQRADLEAAGINPLFGMGSAPSTALGGGSVGMPDYVGEKNNRQQNILQGIQLGQEYSAKRAQIKNLEQQTKTEEYTTLLEAQNVIGQQLNNLMQQKDLSYYDRQRETELRKLEADITNAIEQATNAREERRGISARNRALDSEADIIGREAAWIKSHPILSGFGIGMQKVGTPTMGAIHNGLEGYSTIRGRNVKSAKRAARGANK